MIGLNAQGFSIHSMREPSWTIFDKVHQHRQIVLLEEKDHAVTLYHKAKVEHQDEKLIGRLRLEVRQKQDDLRNSLEGNQRKVWSTLSGHYVIQRAFGNLTSDVVAEHLQKENDLKRKRLDIIQYRKRNLMNKYKQVVLKASKMEDKLIVQRAGMKTQMEKKKQDLALRLQHSSMKVIAAKDAFQTYNSILKILNKDQIYYECVLKCLSQDSVDQSDMIMSAVKMGQVATEYVDDLTEECDTIELEIKANMKVREKSLNVYRSLKSTLKNGLSKLIPTGSKIFDARDSTLPVTPDISISQELVNMNNLFDKFKSFVHVPNVADVFPKMWQVNLEQNRIKKWVLKLEKSKNDLWNHTCSTGLYLSLIKHTYNEDKIQYLENKRDLLQAIREQQQRLEIIRNEKSRQKEQLLSFRLKFNHMRNVLSYVKDHNEEKDYVRKSDMTNGTLSIKNTFHIKSITSIGLEGKTRVPVKNVEDVFKEVKRKLKILHDAFTHKGILTRQIEIFFDRTSRENYFLDESIEIDLLTGITFEDDRIPTNRSIKELSKEVVKDNTIDELALLTEKVRSKRKPGAIFRKYFREEKKRRKRNTCAL